ncbi:MAG: hypothetical protein ACRDHP_17045 [Ktedonobacterales bacterium]
MSNPPLPSDVAWMRQRQMRSEAASARRARAARRPGPRPEAGVLLSLADGLIALGMRLRRRYQPGESLALVPLARLSEDAGGHTSGFSGRSGSMSPVFAFQVIQCLPQRTTSLTYWSLLPSASGAPGTPGGLGLLCLARPLK